MEHSCIPSSCSLNYEEGPNNASNNPHILHIVPHYGSFPPLGFLFSYYSTMSLHPMDTNSLVTSLSISHLQLSSQYYSYDPSPMSQFHLLLSQPYRHTLKQRKFESLALPYPCSPSQCVSSHIFPHHWLSPSCFQSRIHHFLDQLQVSLYHLQHIYS